MSRPTRSPSEVLNRRYAGKFTAFTDYLLLGVMVAICSIPVVTLFAAFTAGTWLSRDREAIDATIGVREYVTRLRTVLGSSVMVLVVPTLVLAIVAIDVIALYLGLGASALVTALTLSAVLLVGTIALRIAALYTPGARWMDVVKTAAVSGRTDLSGIALLASALLVSIVFAAWVPPIVIVLPGPLCLAASAIVARHRTRQDDAIALSSLPAKGGR